ncbi:hypothetical protein [Bacillus toyonensis]|uniref:hypothetical protein n=1 Tax=Bacillus toyonensis TaxID=155322 RepID=UPI001156AC37|nr:hypothetical protein [Bacillus toyonensis]
MLQLNTLVKIVQDGFNEIDQCLETIELKANVANRKIASLREDVTGITKQIIAHRIAVEDHFIKLYNAATDKETEIEVLN